MMLSIGMMVKNESKYLRQCLESLKPIRDAIDSELIIVDTGSTDNTVEIAKEFTDKVYYHEWKDNFSEMRNITISYCSGEWFLVIDGDEVISNPNGIIQFFKDNKHKKYNTACVSVKNFSFENNENNYSVLLSPRLFKKDVDFRYEGAVHNQPKFKQPVLELKSEFVHYGYISDDKELMERKFKRTAAILKNELKNDPENIYYLFQLSVSYAMHGDFEEALNPICNAYNIVKKKKLNLKDYLYVYGQLAKTYFTNGKYQEAEDTCLEAIEDDNIYIDLHFYLARAQFMMNKNEQAIENYNIYLHKVKNFNVSQITKDITIINDTLGNSENAYLDLSIIYNRIGKFEVALEFAKKILSNNILSDAFNLIILLYIKLNKLDELRDFYKNNVLAKNIELKDKFLGSLEQHVLQNDSATREKVYKAFSKGNSEYSLLNRVRISYKDIDEDLNQEIERFDFNKLPNYYGDLIYYLLSNKVALENILSKTNDFRIKFYFDFLLSKYEKLGIKIYEYLKAFKNSKMTFDVIRIKRILSIYFFKSNCVNDDQYKEIFNDYLEYGYNYLIQVYNDNIIENELVYSIKDEEDLFIMYMHLAKKYKEDKAQYLKNLRMALNACQYMKKGIQMLGEEVSQDLIENSDEMNAYKKKVKESITEMINNNNFIDAKKCIDQYEQIIKEDSEIYSMKAVIAIMENKLENAEIILLEALEKYNDCFDLNYNLAYVYEQMRNDNMALNHYKKAQNLAADERLVEEINNKIQSLKN